MHQTSYHKNRQLLYQLMQQAKISSLSQLSKIAGISERQLLRLQYGLMPKMQIENLLKLSQALQVSVNQLLDLFCPDSLVTKTLNPIEDLGTIETLKQEYRRLQEQMEQQREEIIREFQESSLQAIESWLLQWPTAAAAAQENLDLPAKRLLPLVKPVTELLNQWGVEAIATVGEEIPYNPQWHQLMEGNAQPGDLVMVRYVGYRQGEKLLHRAKVSPARRHREARETREARDDRDDQDDRVSIQSIHP
jgi:DNA-binding Xre family transcriptional regulator/molecular chaperone GrpE (heat shock protein)